MKDPGALPAPAGSGGVLGEGPRLAKVLASAGVASRRICEELIAAGRVTINGEVALLGRRIDPERDRVQIDGVPRALRTGLVYYLLNKPAGVVSTASDPHGRRSVVDLVSPEVRVHPVGRLDRDTEGLLLLTNDGDLTYHLTHPRFGVDKEYLALVTGKVRPSEVRRLREGVVLDDGLTAPARVSVVAPDTLRIVIHEGRNRQVRRMCAAVGHPVLRLVRTRIANLADRNLAPGEWRTLRDAEVQALQEAAARTPPSTDPAGDPGRQR